MGKNILPFGILILIQLLTSCHSHCDVVNDIEKIEIKGKIKKKYRMEWNHDSPEIDFSNSANNDHIKSIFDDNVYHIYLVREKSGFWKYVQAGDSIVKERGSFAVTVFRTDTLAKKFNLDYGCK
jgi:hypothetical protein